MLRAQENKEQSEDLGPWVSTPKALADTAQELLDRFGAGWEFEATVTIPRQVDRVADTPQALAQIDVQHQPEAVSMRFMSSEVRENPFERSRVRVRLSRIGGVSVMVTAGSEDEANSKMMTLRQVLAQGKPRWPSWRSSTPYPLYILMFAAGVAVALVPLFLIEHWLKEAGRELQAAGLVLYFFVLGPFFYFLGMNFLPGFELHDGKTRMRKLLGWVAKGLGALVAIIGLVLTLSQL